MRKGRRTTTKLKIRITKYELKNIIKTLHSHRVNFLLENNIKNNLYHSYCVNFLLDYYPISPLLLRTFFHSFFLQRHFPVSASCSYFLSLCFNLSVPRFLSRFLFICLFIFTLLFFPFLVILFLFSQFFSCYTLIYLLISYLFISFLSFSLHNYQFPFIFLLFLLLQPSSLPSSSFHPIFSSSFSSSPSFLLTTIILSIFLFYIVHSLCTTTCRSARARS